MKYELVATATFGLEAVVRREIESLGYKVLKTEDGRVTYQGDERGVVRSNLWLRTADRVYVKMGEFEAHVFEDLYQQVKGIPWENLMPADAEVVAIGTSVKSKLHSVPACQSITKKAIVDRLCDVYGLESLPETGAKYTVRFAILKDKVLILVDTSGEGLHKRGYRVSNVAAPIKETLAAALVQLSFWNKDRILVDPCCGSGTIGIEAALIGLNIAPGLGRGFASESWDIIGEDVWKSERKACYGEMDTETNLKIICGDIEKSAIRAAKKNAEAAGVDDHIEFVVGDMAALGTDAILSRVAAASIEDSPEFADSEIPPEGIIISNPPYGERIGEAEQIEKIYDTYRDFFKKNPTWSLFLITPDKEVEEKVFGREANRRRKLYNGRIEVCYYQFHGARKDKKKKE